MTTSKQRTKDSANAFFQSMFNQKPEKDLPIANYTDDRISVSIRYRYVSVLPVFAFFQILSVHIISTCNLAPIINSNDGFRCLVIAISQSHDDSI